MRSVRYDPPVACPRCSGPKRTNAGALCLSCSLSLRNRKHPTQMMTGEHSIRHNTRKPVTLASGWTKKT